MPVVDLPLGIPALPGTHRLHPAHQQQPGEQVNRQIDAGVLRQKGQVGQQPQRPQRKHAPEIAIAEKRPAGQQSRQPRRNGQAGGKGQGVNADALAARRVQPQAQAVEQLRRRVNLQIVRRRRRQLPDDHAGADQQTRRQEEYAPHRDARQQQRRQQPQQDDQRQRRRRRPVGHLHRPHHDNHIQRQQAGANPPVRRAQCGQRRP